MEDIACMFRKIRQKQMLFLVELKQFQFSGRKMTTKYNKDCITKNIVFIKENIASVDRLLHILLQEDVIKWQEMEDIKASCPGNGFII